MKRKLKFKAWDIAGKVMFTDDCNLAMDFGGNVSALDWNDSEGECHFGWQGTEYSKDKFELVQYTGLTDKNGVEIYEGDIAEVYREGEEWNGYQSYTKRVLVKWNDEAAAFEAIDQMGQMEDFEDNITVDAYSVVGNIFANPDLWQKITDEKAVYGGVRP